MIPEYISEVKLYHACLLTYLSKGAVLCTSVGNTIHSLLIQKQY